jgi:hypothetical protein
MADDVNDIPVRFSPEMMVQIDAAIKLCGFDGRGRGRAGKVPRVIRVALAMALARPVEFARRVKAAQQ